MSMNGTARAATNKWSARPSGVLGLLVFLAKGSIVILLLSIGLIAITFIPGVLASGDTEA
jgi:hypothetical protein